MKQNSIIHLILWLGCLLLASCQEQEMTSKKGDDIDLSKVALVTLGNVKITDGDANTRATNAQPLKVGSQFRMYVFKKGDTDINDLLLTRTYTIKTTAGNPVSDDPNPLYLPIGELDIYLVGPVKYTETTQVLDGDGNPLLDNNGAPVVNVVEYDVAPPEGVTPFYNIDLISSLTPLKVEAGANEFQATPLSHRMARMDVVVERPDDALYSNLKVTTITVSHQSTTAEFSFNSQGGTIAETTEGYGIYYPQIVENLPNKKFTSSLLLFPRQAAHMRIAVHFTCNLTGSTAVIDRRLESGIINDKVLPAGKLTTFTTHPTVSGELLFRTRILPWQDVQFPTEEVPSGNNLLFSYSAWDAPFEKEGKKYWKDRSGNGRDAELVGDIRYNDQEKYYYAAAEGAYFRVPDLGAVPVYTLELTAESSNNPQAIAAQFGTDLGTSLKVKLPNAANQLSFTAESSTLNHTFFASDKGYLTNLATYAFARNEQQIVASRNGMATAGAVSVSGQTAPTFTDNRLLYWSSEIVNNSMNHFKLYAARLTRKYLAPGTDELKQNYRNDISVHAQTDVNADMTRQTYIKNGLILNLQGDKAPSTVNGASVWEDISPMKNHAQLFGVTRGSNHYIFNGNGNYMRLLNTLGTLQDYTIEFVGQAEDGTNPVLFQFSSIAKNSTNRDFYMAFPSNGPVSIDSPKDNGRGEEQGWSAALANFPYASVTDKVYQYSITRTSDRFSNGFSINQCGVPIVGKSTGTDTPVNEMRYCYIGQNGKDTSWFKGKVYAIRVYNRALSSKERQINYQIDKAKYTLLY